MTVDRHCGLREEKRCVGRRVITVWNCDMRITFAVGFPKTGKRGT